MSYRGQNANSNTIQVWNGTRWVEFSNLEFTEIGAAVTLNNAGGSLTLTSLGGATLESTAGLANLTGAIAQVVTTTGGISLQSADNLAANIATGAVVNAGGVFTVASGSTLSLTAATGSAELVSTAGLANLSGALAQVVSTVGAVSVQSAANLLVNTATTTTFNSGGTLSLTAVAGSAELVSAVGLANVSGALAQVVSTSGNLSLQAATSLTASSTTNMDLTVGGNFDMTATGTAHLEGSQILGNSNTYNLQDNGAGALFNVSAFLNTAFNGTGVGSAFQVLNTEDCNFNSAGAGQFRVNGFGEFLANGAGSGSDFNVQSFEDHAYTGIGPTSSILWSAFESYEFRHYTAATMLLLNATTVASVAAGRVLTWDGTQNVYAALPIPTPVLQYTVGAAGTGARFTTIQAAITQAITDGADYNNPAAVIIWPGYYLEDLTLTGGGISLIGISDANEWGAYIDGTISFTAPSADSLWTLSGLGVSGAVVFAGGVGATTYGIEIGNCSFFAEVAVAAPATPLFRAKNCLFQRLVGAPCLSLATASPARILSCTVIGTTATNAVNHTGEGLEIRNTTIVGSLSYGGVVGTASIINTVIYTLSQACITDSCDNPSEIFGCTLYLEGTTNPVVEKVGAGVLYHAGNAYIGSGVNTSNLINVVAGSLVTGGPVEPGPSSGSLEAPQVDATTTITVTTTATRNELTTYCTNSGARVATLPAVGSTPDGTRRTIKEAAGSAAPIQVVVASGGTIDGVAAYNITAAYQAQEFEKQGTQWWKI